MPETPKWRRYLRFWRPDPAGDVDDELRTHLELRVAELVAQGMPSAEAEAQAHDEFGDVESTRRGLVEIGQRMSRRRARFLWWDAARADLRYALRGLRASPLFTAAVVFTLAIGIGAATTMYDVMRGLLLQPPPQVVAPERLVKLHFQLTQPGDSTRTFGASSFAFYEHVRDETRTLARIAAFADRQDVAVGRGGDAELASATMVSAGFWRTLGVAPLAGRLFSDAEAHPATGARVVVLGHAFWQRRFGGDPGVVGRTIAVKGLPYQVIGVAPRGFRGVELAETDVWLPLFAYGDDGVRAPTWHTFETSSNLVLVARLAPGVPPARAEAEISQLYPRFLEEATRRIRGDDYELPGRYSARLAGLTGALGGDMHRIPEATVAVWLVGVAGVLLAVACANVGGLLLLRAMRRRREIAVRLSLGMSRRRLGALLFTESALLAFLGGAAGAVVIIWGGAWVRHVLLPDMATERAGTDWRLLAVAAGCTVGTALLTGLAPMLQVRDEVAAGLRDGGQHGATRRSLLFRTLLVAQTALSVVLLVGAGLFLRSIERIAALDLGMDVHHVLTLEPDFTGSGRSSAERTAYFGRALERVRAVPGVAHASLAQSIPLRWSSGGGVRLSGDGEWLRTEHSSPTVNYVADDFFAATGMRVIAGRGIHPADRAGAPVVVLNESLARLGWPGRSPVGECAYISSAPDVCATVVGVVADTRTLRLHEEQRLSYYAPLAPDGGGVSVLLVRHAPGVTGLEGSLRQALHELDPALPFVDIRVLGDALDPQMRPWRLGATVFTAFGVLAALLAALGLYAAVAYAVTQRTREIGVRLAIGATARQVIALVLGDGVRTALGGIVLGLVLALVGGRWIADLLFDVSPRDPVVFACVAGALLAAALLASLAPARRASKVDPMTALRTE